MARKNTYHVVTSSAKMPNSCWGRYARIGVLECVLGYEPRRIDDRPKQVVRIVETWERLHVGSTSRCAFEVALQEAKAMAERLNAKGE